MAALLFAMGALTYQASAQLTYYRVTFKDKGTADFSPGSELYQQTLQSFHPHALERRSSIGMDPLLTSEDQPIHSAYLAEILDLDVRDPVVSNWRNCIVLATDTITANRMQAMAFVDTVIRTNIRAYDLVVEDCSPSRPGISFRVHDALNTNPLHDAGVLGQGAVVSLIDNGFRLAEMTSMRHVDIRDTYDVIYNDENVGNEPGDPSDQDGHGSLVLSVAAGWEQDSLIGVAPFAGYLLVKSEDMRFERRVEEDFFAAAVEWSERQGADIISASLGYFSFDSTEQQNPYEVLDGKTTFASRAMNMAAMRGVICIAAAGNSGPDSNTINSPADADSVIAVGGVIWPIGFPYPQTSVGPTADGRNKPDLAAVGVNVVAQGPDGLYIRASGTSMASPQIAGLTALMKQLYPDVPPWEIRKAIFTSCTDPSPEETKQLGRGVPDGVLAARLLGTRFGPGIAPPVTIQSLGQQRVLCAVFCQSYPQVQLIVEGQPSPLNADLLDTLWYSVDLTDDMFTGDILRGRLMATWDNVVRYFPSDSTWFTIPRSGNKIPCGVRLPDRIVTVEQEMVGKTMAESHSRTPHLFPSPIPRGQSSVFVNGLRGINTIFLVNTSSGLRHDVHWTLSSDGRALVQIPSLPSGHYYVVIERSTDRTALPLIIY